MTSENAVYPPTTNRGVANLSYLRPPTVTIDWLSLTYRVSKIDPDVMRSLFKSFCARYVQKMAKFDLIQRTRNGFHNRYVCYLGNAEAACFAWGGNDGWAQLEIRGQICRMMKPGDWKLFRWMAERWQVRLKRVDLPLDFYNGEVTMEKLVRAWNRDPSSVMSYRGKVPMMQPGRGSHKRTGRSYYIGAAGVDSKKLMNVYEKGMQIARLRLNEDDELEEKIAVEARKWVRCELRLKEEKRNFVIPYDVLEPERWADYIGSFGPFFKKHLPDSKTAKLNPVNRARYTEFAMMYRRRVLHHIRTYGKFHYFNLMVLGPELYLKLLCDETGVWSGVEQFPDFQHDPMFRDLIGQTSLELIQQRLQGRDQWVSPENLQLHELRQWLKGEVEKGLAEPRPEIWPDMQKGIADDFPDW